MDEGKSIAILKNDTVLESASYENNIHDKEEKNMTKSKIIKANEKIAENVTNGFQKIQDTVVSRYAKIEDRFIENYLTRDGETIEEAKKRLKKEQKVRESQRTI